MAGYGFYPSVAAGATITRADHTDDFIGNRIDDVPIYLTVIHYGAFPDPRNAGVAGPALVGANFMAYDGSNPLVSVPVPWGMPGRFSDNRDGTVTDSVTGLIWLKNAGCLSPGGWASSLAQVNALSSGACGLTDGSLAGQWRLPNINELESVVDVSASNPALTPGHPFVNVSNAIYWSSTSYFGGEEGSPSAWAIRMGDGRFINDSVANDKATASNQVWAVKGNGGGATAVQSTGQYVVFAAGDDGSIQRGVPLTFPRWVDKGDGTVADTVTGLVWLKQADCIHQQWADALAAVRSLSSGQCGLTDGSTAGSWRMPSRKEMQSLSDRMQNNHADFFNHTFLNPDGTVYLAAVFTNFISFEYYWTSSTNAADITRAWTVFSCDFGVYDALKANIGYTLAVRDAQGSDTPTTSGSGTTSAPTAAIPAFIETTSGDNQTAAVNTVFASPFQATVRDFLGNGVANAAVTFSAPGAGASGTFPGYGRSATAVTNSAGIATSPVFAATGPAGQFQMPATVTGTPTAASFMLTNTAAAAIPAITSVGVANGGTDIAQNTWIVIRGTNLTPTYTPQNGVVWSTAPEFASGHLPTQLSGFPVTVTVNQRPAYLYFFCAAATSSCAGDQINVLTPLDDTVGPVQIVVAVGGVSSAPFTVNMRGAAPAFPLVPATQYSLATHADNSLVGPVSLSAPGYPFTPARPNETISFYGFGFGLPSAGLASGSAAQSGTLPALPGIQIGGLPASVTYAGVVSPGLYLFNVVVPGDVPSGDNSVTCTYGGASIAAGTRIAVQR